MSFNYTLNKIKSSFIEKNSSLKKSKPWRAYNFVCPDNVKLKSAASRITVPNKFKPYIEIVEHRTDFKFKGNYLFTVDEVIQQDEIILKNYSSQNFDFSNLRTDVLIKASLLASQELGFDKVSLELNKDLVQCAKSFPAKSSSCYPDYLKKGDPIAIENAVNFASKFLFNKPNYKDLFTQITTLFHRFQYKVGSDGLINKKARPIWGIPFGVNVVEAFFFRSFVDEVTNYLVTNNALTSSLGRNLQSIGDNIIRNFRSHEQNLVSLDLKAFDSTVPSYMWALFFANIESIHYIDPEFHIHFDCLLAYYVYTPYVYRSDEIKFQRKGTPSGCLLTAIFNTWVNRTIINYALLIETDGQLVLGRDLCVLGDDNLFPTTYISLESIIQTYTKFGMTVNTEKTESVLSTGNIPFLGYIWDRRNRAIQSENWFITHLCLPSSFAINLDIPVSLYQTFRAISVCLPLYNGFNMFMKLIGFEDFVFKDLYNKYISGQDTSIRYITNDRRFENLNFPLSLFIEGTWQERSNFATTEQ